jgi:hypothetical protein
MRLVTLFLLATLAATFTRAASYQKTDGTIVDSIQRPSVEEKHFYTGVNLEPGVNQPNANFAVATVTGAQDMAAARGNGTTNQVGVWQVPSLEEG